jgi:hypothetical protein
MPDINRALPGDCSMPSRPIDVIIPLDLNNEINVKVRVAELLDSEEKMWPDPTTAVTWQGSIDVRHRLAGRMSQIELGDTKPLFPLHLQAGVSL